MIHFTVITQKFGQLCDKRKKMAFVICMTLFFLTPSSVFCQASSYALIWLEITFDWRIVKVPSIHLFDLFVPDWHHVSRCILTLESNLFQLIKMHCLYTLHTLTHLLTLTTFVPIRPICCSTEFRLKARYSCVRGHFDFQPKCTSFYAVHLSYWSKYAKRLPEMTRD